MSPIYQRFNIEHEDLAKKTLSPENPPPKALDCCPDMPGQLSRRMDINGNIRKSPTVPTNAERQII
jgi:hypothetical protein